MFSKSSSGSSASSADASTQKKSGSAPTVARTPAVPSLLSQDLVITGDIKTDGEVQIDGRLDGNLTASRIMVGEHGAVNGKVVATSVIVRGKVTGKIDASSIELSETANVQADLIQDKLIIANGAFFDGKCARKSTTPTPIKATQISA